MVIMGHFPEYDVTKGGASKSLNFVYGANREKRHETCQKGSDACGNFFFSDRTVRFTFPSILGCPELNIVIWLTEK